MWLFWVLLPFFLPLSMSWTDPNRLQKSSLRIYPSKRTWTSLASWGFGIISLQSRTLLSKNASVLKLSIHCLSLWSLSCQNLALFLERTLLQTQKLLPQSLDMETGRMSTVLQEHRTGLSKWILITNGPFLVNLLEKDFGSSPEITLSTRLYLIDSSLEENNLILIFQI